MPLFKVDGWDHAARPVTWYIDAESSEQAEGHAAAAGVTDPRAQPMERSAVPAGQDIIRIGAAVLPPARHRDRYEGLVWRIAVGTMLGILGASLVLALFGAPIG